MDFYALESVEETVEDTKDILFPFDLNTWAKLGLIAFLAGGSGLGIPNMSGGNFDSGPSTGSQDFFSGSGITGDITSAPGELATGNFAGASPSVVGYAAIALIFLFGAILLYIYISSVFSFIYYRSLLDRDVAIKQNFWDNTGNGARYFAFRISIGLAVLGTILGAVMVVLVSPLLIIPFVLLLIPIYLVVSALMTLIHDFALLEMLEEDKNLINAIRSVFSIFRVEWKQTLAYLIVKIGIGIAASLVSIIGAMAVFLALLIPFGLAIALGFYLHLYIGILAVIAGILAFLSLLALFVMAPVGTFVHYYAINNYQKFKS